MKTIGTGHIPELQLQAHSTPFGRRLIVQVVEDNGDGAPLHEREVEELRDACQAFLDGEAI